MCDAVLTALSLSCHTDRKAKALVSKVVEDAGGVASLPMPYVSGLLSVLSSLFGGKRILELEH